MKGYAVCQQSTVLVDYDGAVYRDFPGVNHIIPMDYKHTVMVDDRTTRHTLVSKGTFIALGLKLPADIDKLYAFRNILLEGMTYTLILLEWKRQQRSVEVQKYLQFLTEELEMI